MIDCPFLPPPKVRVINAPSNIHDMAKHISCSLATHSSCYFNDDDWLNPYLDALYAKYLDQGGDTSHRIVTNTMPYVAWESRRWRFENPGTSNPDSLGISYPNLHF
jgi:hypothetical protein